VPVEEGEILTTGSVIHDILRDYTLECHKQKKTHLYDVWKDLALETMRRHQVLPKFENDIMEAVKLYVEANEIELEGLAGVEEKISIDRDLKETTWEKAWFRAILDKLYLRDDYCKISDYKTGFNLHPDELQLEIYVWLISLLYPHINYFEVELDFTRFNSKRVWQIEKDRIPDIQKKVLNRCQQIEEVQVFDPRVSSLCYDCPLWNLCPAIKQVGGDMPRMPMNPDEADKLLEEIIAREKDLKESKSLLKAYCEKYGGIVHEDMKAYFKAIENTKYDIPALLEWANENGKNVIEAFSLDGRKAKKLGIPDDLKEIKISTRFTIGRENIR
jgi:hypothetical protein